MDCHQATSTIQPTHQYYLTIYSCLMISTCTATWWIQPEGPSILCGYGNGDFTSFFPTSLFFVLFFFADLLLQMQRNNPEKWKCQPHRFLKASIELHGIIIGSTDMTIGGTLSGFLACWIINGNSTMFYYQLDKYGYLYFLLSFVMVFFWIDGVHVTFYYHKLMHTSLLEIYKHLHKQNHQYDVWCLW